MTTQKKLKRAVRTRMEKTGERFAAARRSLVGDDPPAPTAPARPRDPRLLPGYVRVGGPLGEVSPLANALAAAGIRAPHTDGPYSEALLYGIGGGVGGGYFAMQYTGTPPVVVVGTRNLWQDPDGFLTRLLRRIEVEPVVHETAGRKSADAALDRALSAGHPVLAWTDRASLPYTGLPPELRQYMVSVVGVCGREANAGIVLVDDRAGAPLEVDWDAFSVARGLIKTSKHRLIEVHGAASPGDLGSVVLEAIMSGHRERTESKIKNFGLPAIRKWADMVVDEKDPKGWPRTFPPGQDLFRALVWAFWSIETGSLYGGTSGGASRGVFASFLDEAATITGRTGLSEVAHRYRELARAWTDLADAILPDEIESFRRTKALERERWRLFEAPEGPDLIRFRDLTRQALPTSGLGPHEPAGEFPLTDAQRLDLFASLHDRLVAIHQGEVQATTELAVAAR